MTENTNTDARTKMWRGTADARKSGALGIYANTYEAYSYGATYDEAMMDFLRTAHRRGWEPQCVILVKACR